jgi:ABC-type transport system substrate-binding protein
MRSFPEATTPSSERARRPAGPRKRHWPAAGVAGAITATACLVLAACGGGGSSSVSTTADRTGGILTVGFSVQAPQTLDPAKTPQNYAWFEELAYEPLIVRHSNGTLAPGLATSWSYTGTGNTTFVLHLRRGATFSDGSPLTAAGVAADLRYVAKAGGQMAPFLAGDTFTATGPATVTIKAAKPNPVFPEILTQDDVVGGIISQSALRSPAKLGTQTFGAGPYKLDPSQTVAGDHYTYVPNPHYYDKSAVRWKKVVIKVITNPQSMLNAIKTGQVQAGNGDPTTIVAARQAGLTVTNTPDLWMGAVLADRNGKMSGPLAKLGVRQALNYATNRASITGALFSGAGTPTRQLSVPGADGYAAALTSAYPYNPGKARQLLTAAGYPHGFSLKMVTGEYGGMNLMAQALAQQWRAVGVKLAVTDDANANEYYSAAFGGKFPAFMTVFGQIPVWVEGPSLYLPTAAYNPFHTASPELARLYAAEARSSGAHQVGLDQQIQAYLVHQAWFVPVTTIGLPYYAQNVTGTSTTPRAPLLDLYEVRPAS